jgi:hypothetical protein
MLSSCSTVVLLVFQSVFYSAESSPESEVEATAPAPLLVPATGYVREAAGPSAPQLLVRTYRPIYTTATLCLAYIGLTLKAKAYSSIEVMV